MDRRRLLQRGAAMAPVLLLSAATLGSRPGEETQAPDGGGTDPALSVSVRDFGAKGDGDTDDTKAIEAAQRAVLRSRRDDGQVTREIVFPAGTYRVTRQDALLGSPSNGSADQVRGLTLRGIGKRGSEIFFDTDAGASKSAFDNNLMTAANRLRALRVTGLSFRSQNPNQNWIYCWSRDEGGAALRQPSRGVGGNQDFVLEDVEWRGTWNRVIGLDGDGESNLNSEWAFYNCHVSNSGEFTDAFLHSGMSPQYTQQDQFLNFWFYACKFEYAAGTLLKLRKGGFVNIFGGSWIAGVESSKPATLLSMPPESHVDSVQNLSVVGTRFELRHPGVTLMNCGWSGASAHITFQNVSDASQSFRDWAAEATPVVLRPRDGAVPTVKFLNCELMGHHRVEGAAAQKGRIVYDGCNMANHPQGGVGPGRFLRYDGAAPSYRFVDCYGVPDTSG